MHKPIAQCLTLLALLASVPPAALASFSTVDLVRIQDGRVNEALYYYENNWKRHRERALEEGYIEAYQLLLDKTTSGAETLLLVTTYANEAQYAAREENFARIMPADGRPDLLNDIAPGEFRAVEDLGVFESR